MPRSREGGKYYTPEELLDECDKYIKSEGTQIIRVGLNFGEVVHDTTHVIVTIKGLCEWLDVNVDYLLQLTKPAYNKDKESRAAYSRVFSRIKQKLSVHNDKGNSIGEINNKAYAIWKAKAESENENVRTKEDIDEQKQRIKRMKIENKHLEQRLASDIDWKQSRTEANDVKTDKERANADKLGTSDNIEYDFGSIYDK